MSKSKVVKTFLLVIALGVSYMALRPSNDDFYGLLDYEAQNRAFALLSVQEAVQGAEDADQRQFWEAYLALEELNQIKYAELLEKHGVSAAPSTYTRFRIWGGNVLFPLMPDMSVRIMRDAAVKYVPKLERLETLAAEDREVFAYIVAQEQVQVDGLVLAAEGKYVEGAVAIESFVNAHSNPG